MKKTILNEIMIQDFRFLSHLFWEEIQNCIIKKKCSQWAKGTTSETKTFTQTG